MAKKFSALVKKMSPERQGRIAASAQLIVADVTLRELRERLGQLSQEEIANLLQVSQPYVSKLERQGDMLVSKLYEYVHALGGQVEIHAKFKSGNVVITQFEDINAKLHQERG